LAEVHSEIEPLAFNESFGWQFRGQVLPTNQLVTTEVEITSVEQRQGRQVVGLSARLWVDGLCIYEMPDFAATLSGNGYR
jgi:hypothetical protein